MLSVLFVMIAARIKEELLNEFNLHTIVRLPNVTGLKELQKEVDALKSVQASTAADLDALMPSILDEAFRGEL